MKKFFVLLLIGVIATTMLQAQDGFTLEDPQGEVTATTASPTSPTVPATETLEIKLGDHVYVREMPTSMGEALDLLRMMTQAFEKVSNLALSYSQSHLNNLEELISGVDDIELSVVPIQEIDVAAYEERLAALAKNQAKMLTIGTYFVYNRDLLNMGGSFGPLVQFNLFNTVQIGAGAGFDFNTSGSVGFSLSLTLGYWLF